MRVRVLPRDLAGRIINGTVATIGWAVGGSTILLTIPVLIETLSARGRAADLPVPIMLLVLILLGIGAVARWRRTEVVLVYLAVAAVATLGYELVVVQGDPTILDTNLFLVNRPTLALVAVGVTATTALSGILWSLFGLVIATSVSLAASLIAGVPFRPGFGPVMVFLIATVAYLTFAAIQNAQRRKVPNFEELEAETLRLARGEDLSRATTAAVHDTVLNDLSIVLTTTDTLSEDAIARLRRDLEELRGAAWISQTTSIPTADDEDASLRNELMRLVSDFQWQGLSIHVTGSGSGVYKLAPDVARALVAAVRAAFENVVKHSGATVAELELIYADDITLMVTDQGAGFDMAKIPADRLGVRTSIIQRIEDVGGSAQIWSSPGGGTSVVLTIPFLKMVSPHPESTHRERNR
ncbi:MAG TPA: ATP-binding protein [Pseudolysinimonas sp.]|jgi:signal transduction histidine kinase|nr:ATP-binding protein [Pseudolysinimonas sp.]